MKVGIIGAGTMGSGIAQVFAQAEGYQVMLCDINDSFAAKGKNRILQSYQKRVKAGKMTEEQMETYLERITTGTKERLCADCDLVVEAALEVMAIKKETFEALDSICKPECILATNTSSLSVTEIGNGLVHPVVGMHFFNPAPVMKLVEVIAGGNTPAELVEWTKNLSLEIGKTPVVVNEAPGFVVNKILIPYCNEGVCVLQEGVASAEDIDIAMQLGCNHPMGPLHLGDLIGWDVVLNIMDVLFNETHDSKYRANVMIRKMVRAGKLGMKSGEGIFNYKK